MIKRIVLTGGPCAGKTTALSRIEQDLCEKGYKVFIVGESATELIRGGIFPNESSVGMLEFQKLIMFYQYQKEDIYDRAVMKSKDENIVIIYDRGLLDNKSYINDEEFEIVLNDLSSYLGKKVSEIDLASRYDMIIHLVTSAGRRGYSLESNQARYESEDEALLLDKRTMNAWIVHNNLQIVDNTDDFDEKMNKVISLIHGCLGEESLIRREKKFIVQAYISKELVEKFNGLESIIEQYYIENDMDESEIRLRKINYDFGCNYYYVVQNALENGIKKVLVEKKISEQEFNRLVNSNVISMINKKRISFTYEKQFCKLDLFSDGLMVLEVILNDEKMEVLIPDCFKVIREVTDDKDYKNINLGIISRSDVKRRAKELR